jgi:hypothetical protein
MHGTFMTDGELLSILSLTALFVWVIATYWTKRRLTKAMSANAAPALLEPVQQENRELRSLVDRLENRIRVLETIATDPSERTAREIEELR